jgi:hypothetical protein
MQNQKTLRQRIEQLFGFPAMKMPWSLYIAQLNEAGKLTARSIMDIMTVVLEVLEQQEEEIKDMKLVSESKHFYQESGTEKIPEIMTTDDPDKFLKDKPEELNGLTVKEKLGKLYCANCGTEIINTTEWKEKHLKECKEVKEPKLPKELQEEKS